MELLEKQQLFSELVRRLLGALTSMGYKVTFGEAWRSPETAKMMVSECKGIARSLHTERLAIDLCLFKDGKYLTDTKDYEDAGKLWKAMSSKDYVCAWGGDFRHLPDGNHFSIEHEGIR